MGVQYRKILTFLLAVVILMTSMPMPVVAEALIEESQESVQESVAYIPDENLKRVIQKALRKGENEVITEEDMLKLYTLEIRPGSNYIEDLTGLELAENLRKLEIMGHFVNSLEPISDLKKLVTLKLVNNSLTNDDIQCLRKLKQLTFLRIDSNLITDVSSLASLEKLRTFQSINHRLNLVVSEDEFEFIAWDRKGEICQLATHFENEGYYAIEGTKVKILKPYEKLVPLKYESADGEFSGTILLDISQVVVGVDKSDLQRALDDLKKKVQDAKVSQDGMDIDIDDIWVTEEGKNILLQVETDGRAILANSSASQEEVKAGLEAIEEALDNHGPQMGFRYVTKRTRKETIPFETETIEDNEKYTDDREVIQEGKEGLRTIVEEVTYLRGKESKREIISNEVTTQPVPKIIRVGTKPIETTETESRKETIPYKTVYIQDSNLEKGKTLIKQEGRDGEKTVEEKIFFTKGLETGREIISEKIRVNPVDKIIHIGTRVNQKIPFPIGPSPSPRSEKALKSKEGPPGGGVKPKTSSLHKLQDVQGHWAEEVIEFVINEGYFKGTSETSFKPNREITRGEFITVLGRMEGVNPANFNQAGLADLESGAFYEGYVNWAVKEGVIMGYEDGSFGPHRTISRQEMATVLYRLLHRQGAVQAEEAKINFLDQDRISGWAQEAVEGLSSQGILQGRENGQFAPREKLTRAEVAQVIYNIKTANR